jgi:uncharacterized hydrophobic protein (TIGR00271 family)
VDIKVGSVGVPDIERMRSKLYIVEGLDRKAKWSAFWVLLVLASIIASAGVVADSTATVIGAMIVAPLMTPILGVALALVLAERRQLVANLILVVTGGLLVIAIGFLVGFVHQVDILAETNSQVAGRINPTLIDLMAALATGAVGAFALVRADISDTLPGVAIAISLVPPLAVVGLTLESGSPSQAAGALLLFGTNVAAIIATGTLVLLMYRIRPVAREAGVAVGRLGGRTLAAVVAGVLVVAVPLGIGSHKIVQQSLIIAEAQGAAEKWAERQGWQIAEVEFSDDVLVILALGPPPEADAATLRADLDEIGLQDVDVRVTLVVGGSADLPATG